MRRVADDVTHGIFCGHFAEQGMIAVRQVYRAVWPSQTSLLLR